MKIRTGFVSNSSSSSFTIVMTKDQEQVWFDSMNVYEKQLIENSYIQREQHKLDTIEVAVYAGSQGDYSFYEEFNPERIDDDSELSDDELADKYGFDEFRAWAIWEKVQLKLPKNIVDIDVDM